MGLPSVKTAWS